MFFNEDDQATDGSDAVVAEETPVMPEGTEEEASTEAAPEEAAE